MANDTDAPMKAPREGFAKNPTRGKFSLHNGPTYRSTGEGDVRAGMWVLDRHCNGMGFLHGGMASAFADSALAWAVFDRTQQFSVTIKLTLEYLETVYEGTWLEAHTRVKAVDGELVHVTANLVREDGAVCCRADAVFRTLKRKKARRGPETE